ncbi:MAG: YihY/virulence factor BrkB family protein [Nitriliruptoraceae bacterium]
MSERIVTAAPAAMQRPVRVVVKTASSAVADRLPGLAAEIAFWVLLSLPALLLAVVASFGLIGDWLGPDWQDQLSERVSETAGLVLADSVVDNTILPVLDQLLEGGGVGLVSIAFIAAVWTASRAVKVVLQTVTIVSARAQLRDGWKDRLIGFGITFAAMLSGIVFAPILLAGPNFGTQISRLLAVPASPVETAWSWAWWPVVLVGATLTIALIYHVGIPGVSRWRTQLPGAAFATASWLLGSAGLRLYGTWFMSTDSIYGSLAGPLVALLWLWLSGFAVLLGAELNAAISATSEASDNADIQ